MYRVSRRTGRSSSGAAGSASPGSSAEDAAADRVAHLVVELRECGDSLLRRAAAICSLLAPRSSSQRRRRRTSTVPRELRLDGGELRILRAMRRDRLRSRCAD